MIYICRGAAYASPIESFRLLVAFVRLALRAWLILSRTSDNEHSRRDAA